MQDDSKKYDAKKDVKINYEKTARWLELEAKNLEDESEYHKRIVISGALRIAASYVRRVGRYRDKRL